MATAFLLFGSNLGDRQQHITDALNCVSNQIGEIIQQSSLYETAAWGNANQQNFYNSVSLIDTKLAPEQLLESILNIEMQLGRVRIQKWEARIIDIDILYYDDLMLESENLTIPHPLLHQRRFTLMPLVEIAPNFMHPKQKKTNCFLLDECLDMLEVKQLNSGNM